MMKKFTFTLLSFLILFSPCLMAQVMPQSSIIKLGMSPEWMPLQETGNFAFDLSIESSTRSAFITSEASAGFSRSASDVYFLSLQYKFYPMTAISKNSRYQGLYFGVGPGFYYQELPQNQHKGGLALFTSMGVQFFLNNRIALGLEMEVNSISQKISNTEPTTTRIMQSQGMRFQKSTPPPSTTHENFSITTSFRVGYLFNRPSVKPKLPMYH